MIYILFPAYNEEKSIDRILPKIADAMAKGEQNDYHIIICDDGSKDKTLEKIEFKQLEDRFLEHFDLQYSTVSIIK